MSANPQAMQRFKDRQRWQAIVRSARAAELRIAVLASFTADSLVPYLGVALEDADLPSELWLGPYNRIHQECLDPESRTARFAPDWVVVCPRLEELWAGGSLPWADDDSRDYREELLQLADACCAAAERWSARLVFVLPAIPNERPLGVGDAGNPHGVAASATAVREALRQRLYGRPGVLVGDLEVLVRELGRDRAANPAMRIVAHIPFSDELFAALGAQIARLIALHRGYGRRVLVLDADDTLWGGRLGELGAEGIDLADGGPGLAHRHLQAYLLERRRAGLTLAVLSPAPLRQVEQALGRPEMRLRGSHFAVVEAGSEAVPAKLARIAARLGAGAEAMALLTADASLRSEVSAELPCLATVLMPEDPAHWLAAIQDSHALDGLLPPPVAAAAQRSGAADTALSLDRFLASLGLEVSFADLGPERAAQVAAMHEQISEFNLAAATRSADEIAHELRGGSARIRGIRVRDRFDEYGTAGLCRSVRSGEALEVDTLMLNCRVLGKRVEAHLVAELAAEATAENLSRIRFRYRPTPRNAPALEFLKQLDAEALKSWEDGWELELPAARAAAWARQQLANPERGAAEAPGPAAVPTPSAAVDETPPTAAPETTAVAARHAFRRPSSRTATIERFTSELTSGEAILAALRTSQRRRLGPATHAAEFVAPRTPTEEIVAGLWSEILQVDRVGVDDNFFRLGGHSLVATRILSRVRDRFRVDTAMRDFFAAPTVAGMARCIDAIRGGEPRPQAPPLEPMARGNAHLPLSFAQQRLWILNQWAPENPFYNLPTAVRLEGRLEPEAIRRALEEVARRHETLRTTFALVDGEPAQVIRASQPLELPLEDLRPLAAADREIACRRRIHAEAWRPFDLEHGPLLRARLLRIGEREHLLLLVMHHIISDGWSADVLVRETTELYRAALSDRPPELPDLPIQYGDFTLWQRQWLAGGVLEDQIAYWKRQLAGAPPRIELPADGPRPAEPTFAGARRRFALSDELSAQIRAFSRQHEVTVFVTLLAAFNTLLFRYTGLEDQVVGSPVAHRNRSEIEGLIGFFVNTLVLRTDLSGNPSFVELLGRVREATLGAYAHQDLPFDRLVKEVRPARDLSHTPLFNLLFILQNAPASELRVPGLKVSAVELELPRTHFDLTFQLWESPEGFTGTVFYRTELFAATSIQRLLQYYEHLLRAAVAEAEMPIAQLPLVSAEEQAKLREVRAAARGRRRRGREKR